MSIGQRLISARLARGWSQHEMARACHISSPAVRLLEADEASPTLRTLQRLADGLEMPLTTLLADSERVEDQLDLLATWLRTAPEQKRRLILEVAKVAGFQGAMMLRCS